MVAVLKRWVISQRLSSHTRVTDDMSGALLVKAEGLETSTYVGPRVKSRSHHSGHRLAGRTITASRSRKDCNRTPYILLPQGHLILLPSSTADVHSNDSEPSRIRYTMFSIVCSESKKNRIHFITISIKIAKVSKSLVFKRSKLQFTGKLTSL